MDVRRALRCVTPAAVLAVAVAAVLGTLATPTLASGTPPTLPTFRSDFLTFRRPVQWTPYVFERTAAPHVTPLVYLSTQIAHNPCKLQGSTRVCSWPIARLSPGGVLVAWENRTFPRWSLAAVSGTLVRVGGRRAKWSSRRPGECKAVGADETIQFAIERPIADSWTAFTACLRRPHLAAAELQVSALLASTRFRAP